METPQRALSVIILDSAACRLGVALGEDEVLTLLAVCSEDPGGWSDMVACWDRYRTPAVGDRADSLPIAVVDRATALRALEGHEGWVVIDLVQKRIVTGRECLVVGRNQRLAMVVDDLGQQHSPLGIHLPPWWEMHEQASASMVLEPRLAPLCPPAVQREVLYGEALFQDLAARLVAAVETQRKESSGPLASKRIPRKVMVQVHRAWLMTPRDDLQGRMPRQLLHGAHDWLDRLVATQRSRFEDGGQIVALPEDMSGYAEAPMGREEMILYFDLCRELLAAGWFWCMSGGSDLRQRYPQLRLEPAALADFFGAVKEQWLNAPDEDDAPPSFIIECSRRRVPRGAGVPIVGMASRQPEQHLGSCDCPICNMLADGKFGPSFIQLDGHYLEMDDEFAFSTCETREAWEEQQMELGSWSETL